MATTAVQSEAAPSRDRIPALDTLRGIAVGGILLANVLVFFGQVFMPAARAAALPTAPADHVARFLEHWLVDGKFYSIFSLLFGIGFGLQLVRGGEAAIPRFRRRLHILIGIGAIHAFLIWAGDILMLYAFLGLLMPWFAKKRDDQLLQWAVGLFALPTVLYLLGLAVWMLVGPAATSAPSQANMPASILAIFEKVGTGTFKDTFLGNLVMLAGRWADLFASVRFPKVLGMFVLGLWTVRTGVATNLAAHRALLVRWCILGLSIGLAANLLAAWGMDHWEYLPPSTGGLIAVVGQGVGVPMLALGYAATVGLLVVSGQRWIGVFAPMGRMALTNYLTHSLVCVTLSYGWGFGLWWNIGASRVMGIAAIILAIQLPLSALWLRRFRFGPVEWVWRRLTYARPI